MLTPLQKPLSLNHYIATLIYIQYICNLNIQRNERNVKPPLKENKFRHTARRTVIKIPGLRDN